MAQIPQYYKEVRILINSLCQRHQLRSILEVGCGLCDNIKQYPIEDKTIIDLWYAPKFENVTCIHGNILNYNFDRQFDIVICLQVLEHIPDIENAIKKIFDLAKQYVIISLPYKWIIGKQPGHIHDPITNSKLTT